MFPQNPGNPFTITSKTMASNPLTFSIFSGVQMPIPRRMQFIALPCLHSLFIQRQAFPGGSFFSQNREPFCRIILYSLLYEYDLFPLGLD